MKHKFFAIPARDPEAAEADMNSFCSQHRVSFVEKQLIMDGADSFWSVCVSYHDSTAAAGQSKVVRKPKVDYKKVFNEEDFGRYLGLHALRKEVAERKGVPSYAIFDNDQLASMIKQRVTSKAGLSAIENVGKKRLESYAEEFLQRLNTFWGDLPESKDETPQDQS